MGSIQSQDWSIVANHAQNPPLRRLVYSTERVPTGRPQGRAEPQDSSESKSQTRRLVIVRQIATSIGPHNGYASLLRSIGDRGLPNAIVSYRQYCTPFVGCQQLATNAPKLWSDPPISRSCALLDKQLHLLKRENYCYHLPGVLLPPTASFCRRQY